MSCDATARILTAFIAGVGWSTAVYLRRLLR